MPPSSSRYALLPNEPPLAPDRPDSRSNSRTGLHQDGRETLFALDDEEETGTSKDEENKARVAGSRPNAPYGARNEDPGGISGFPSANGWEGGSPQGLESDDPLGEDTPLDKTIEKIGMGRYQKKLLVLCGFGWLADNMWLQCVAVILPRVQDQFDVSDSHIGILSASIFCGMMIGASGWGSYSDACGRTRVFNGTLFITAIFGLLAGFAPSFPILCLLLFLVGTGVGGSMPTDGTLFLENIPKSKYYLLTGLSIFFSLGAVLSSALGLVLIPPNSCSPKEEECDLDTQNRGWRYLLMCLGVITLAMLLGRVALFKLQESPRFLVANSRNEEAVIVLGRISRINGVELKLELEDVDDHHEPLQTDTLPVYDLELGASLDEPRRSPPTLGVNGNEDEDASGRNDNAEAEEQTGMMMADSSGERDGNSSSDSPRRHRPRPGSVARRPSAQSLNPLGSRRTSVTSIQRSRFFNSLPQPLAEAGGAYLDRVSLLFEPKWARTTLLVWGVWTFVSLGYTVFNVFLPSFLERKLGSQASSKAQSHVDALKDYVLYTVSGIPGSIAGAYLVEGRLGRRGSMALSTVLTAGGILGFLLVSSSTGVVAWSMLTSFMATLMYAVIYSYTPEAFDPTVRGSACGIASALNRLAGIVAPLATGWLLTISVTLPLLLAIGAFMVSAVFMLGLPETRGGNAGFTNMH